MCFTRVTTARLLLACTVASALSCTQRDATPGTDSAADTAGSPVSTPGGANEWVAELGPLLIVPSDSSNTGVVLFPAAPSPRLVSSGPLTLFTAAGDSVVTRAALVVSDSQVCGEAPTVRFNTGTLTEWSVGLLARTVASIRMDSIEALPPSDSLRLAAEVARLASTLPTHRDSRFTGLRFVVLTARLLEAHGQQILLAHLIRRLPQEATPIEERTFIIAERPSTAAKAAPFAVAYHLRSEGSEETAEHYDVLSAARGAETILLLLARDRETQTSYEVLERGKTGGWRSRWSRILSC